MPIIDIHIHLSDIDSFHRTAIDLSKVDYSAAGLKAEFDKNDVILGIGMGVTEQTKGAFPDSSSPNPMGLDLEEKVPSFLMECVGINPNHLGGDHAQDELDRIEARLQAPEVAGIKLYAGYYHHYVYDKIYTPVYELAAKYNVPVVIHTGDTYSMNGLLKYAHPLTVDELAFQQRGVNFMICHLGDPWVMDAAEVVAKNPNVYADLSGLVVGDRPHFERFMSEPLFMDHFRRALVYSDHYEKMLFGTDWPLAPIDLYAEFVRRLVPERSIMRRYSTRMLLIYFRALNSELKIWVKHPFIIICAKWMPCRSWKLRCFNVYAESLSCKWLSQKEFRLAPSANEPTAP